MRFECEQWLPARREDLFRFFSDATNLQAITPPWLHFRIMTAEPITIREGTTIDYRLRLHGVPLRWRSAITKWNPPTQFVDEQLRGPYRRWVHTHSFVEERDGTTVHDSVEFDIPFAPLVAPFVKRDIRKIFAFRREILAERFPG
jgi:ligand-binding SRPBCC domain-containing protein